MHPLAPALATFTATLLLAGPAAAEIRWGTDARLDAAGEIVHAAFSVDPSLDYLLIYDCRAADEAPGSETLVVQTPRLWLPAEDSPTQIEVRFDMPTGDTPPLAFTSGDMQGFFAVTATREGQAPAFDALVKAIAGASASFTLTFDGRDFAYPPGAASAIDRTRASCGLD